MVLRYSRMNKTNNVKGLDELRYIEERLIIQINRIEVLEFIIIDNEVKYRKRFKGEHNTPELKKVSLFFNQQKEGIKVPSCIIEDEIFQLPLIG